MGEGAPAADFFGSLDEPEKGVKLLVSAGITHRMCRTQIVAPSTFVLVLEGLGAGIRRRMCRIKMAAPSTFVWREQVYL